MSKLIESFTYSLRMSLSTVLLPAPIPPPMRSRTGLRSLCATGAITSVHSESSTDAIPIAFISSTNVLNTLATFRFLVTLSNLCSLLYHQPRNSHLGKKSLKENTIWIVFCCLDLPCSRHDNVLEFLLRLNIGAEYLIQNP